MALKPALRPALRPGGAKAKGADGERELASLLTGWAASSGVRLDLSRNLEQTRSGGHDLMGLEEYGMAVEVKRVEAMNMNGWWKQATRQAIAAGNLTPVLAWRQNRKPWRFRVNAWVYPCTLALDIDLEEAQFRAWFISRIKS